MESEESFTVRKSRARCTTWRTCGKISIRIAAIAAMIILGDRFTYANGKISQTQDKLRASLRGLASSLTGSIELNNHRAIDLRINPVTSGCDGPLCYRCRIQVSSPHHMTAHPFLCTSEDQNVKNSSCYLCYGECKTLDDLLGKRHIVCERPVEITCCLITQMGNLGNVCGYNGEYNCYREGTHDLKPMCKCPDDKSGERCQNSNTDTVSLNCRCYQLPYKFIEQEDMAKCNNIERADVTQCHMDADRHGERHNCICNNMGDDYFDNNDLDSCLLPHTDQQTKADD